MPDESPNFCPRCGIPFAFDTEHPTPQHCIDALRLSLKRQTEAAEGLAFEVSTRIFAVLEGLANDPSVAGIEYSMFNGHTGERVLLNKGQVSGVMTAIFREYQKQGDWSPMRDLKENNRSTRKTAYDLLRMLTLIVDGNTGKTKLQSEHLAMADSVIEQAIELGVNRYDQDS